MKKILFLVFLIISVLFMVPLPGRSAPSYRSEELEKVVNGDATEYYANGVLTYASDLHYARLVRTKTDNEILDRYYDENGEPAKQSAGHYALLRVYQGKNEISRTYLDENLQPTMNTSGYSTRLRVFRDGQVAEVWYKDTEGRPVADSSGVYGQLNGYENGRITRIVYVDAEGKPCVNKSGYAELRRSFYEESPWAGKVKDQFYFDAAGAPAALAKGQYGVHTEYDEQGRTIRTDYLARDGSILYSLVRSYNPDNSVAESSYLDENGEALKKTAGQYVYQNSEGETFYLPAGGKTLNRFLHDEPLVVIIVGGLMLVLSSAATKHVNAVLLVLYLSFIAYMTLWDREGNTRARFELFWSYKQFFTSAKLRLEIMNNIWLFVPLGGILARLGLGRKSIPACALISLCIEMIQYFTGFGLAEFDDVISNTMGGILGIWLSRAFHFQKNENRKTGIEY